MVDERRGGVAAAERDLVSFVGSLFPVLARHLPD
jgi:hypothetical protein